MKISYWLSSDDVSKVIKGTNEGLFNYTEVGFLKKTKSKVKIIFECHSAVSLQ